MYFVGQYDYLLYSLLHRISAEEGRAQADFIVQEIKNSAETVDFLRSLTGKETPFGRFAAVHDEIFLNRPTEEGTVSAIVSAYEEILDGCRAFLEHVRTGRERPEEPIQMHSK